MIFLQILANFRRYVIVVVAVQRSITVNYVDLYESFQTHIYLQNLVSIQPRTSPPRFDRGNDGACLRRLTARLPGTDNFSRWMSKRTDGQGETLFQQFHLNVCLYFSFFQSPRKRWSFAVPAENQPNKFGITWNHIVSIRFKISERYPYIQPSALWSTLRAGGRRRRISAPQPHPKKKTWQN